MLMINNMKLVVPLLVVLSITGSKVMNAQQKDTVVMDLSPSGKIVFTLGNREELPQIKEYDYQAIFDDIFSQIEGDVDDNYPTDISQSSTESKNQPRDDYDDDEFWQRRGPESRDFPYRRITSNFDFGMNNYIISNDYQGNKEQLTVRPWGSWYFALQTQAEYWFSEKFHFELGFRLSDYAFKFQDDATRIIKTDAEIAFTHDERDVSFIKSVLHVSHINISVVPVISIGRRNNHEHCGYWHHSSLRFGVGAYAGYRIGSSAKQRYVLDGDKINDRDRNNFHTNTFRYGVRAQLGIEGTDFFFNYDLNELFKKDKGPKLNAYSFGIIF